MVAAGTGPEPKRKSARKWKEQMLLRIQLVIVIFKRGQYKYGAIMMRLPSLHLAILDRPKAKTMRLLIELTIGHLVNRGYAKERCVIANRQHFASIWFILFLERVSCFLFNHIHMRCTFPPGMVDVHLECHYSPQVASVYNWAGIASVVKWVYYSEKEIDHQTWSQ